MRIRHIKKGQQFKDIHGNTLMRTSQSSNWNRVHQDYRVDVVLLVVNNTKSVRSSVGDTYEMSETDDVFPLDWEP